MNANKLADVFNTYDEPHDWGTQAQAMLRQQQAEIEALKANFNKENTVKEVFNTEPVAWIEPTTNSVMNNDRYQSNPFANETGDWIPLYTHPAKTKLSRMEVYELAIDSGFMLSTQYGQAENKLMPVSDGDTLVKLAKAILRKAQEK